MRGRIPLMQVDVHTLSVDGEERLFCIAVEMEHLEGTERKKLTRLLAADVVNNRFSIIPSACTFYGPYPLADTA
jgi:hypothetical protein